MTVLADRYRLDVLIGRGGVADVHRARDLVLDRDVAVKILREAVEETDRRRFVGEARLLGRLSHVGLVTVLDVGVSDQPYLVMELVHGITLAAALREGPLDPGRAALIGARLASAISYAHEQGVVHRDVKPGNVLLGPAGEAKLADFGIARLVGDTVRHTATGAVIGTPAYLSPEQVRGLPVGPPTDVYSLGLVLLEALTGERAFTGTPVETALARLERPPTIPDDLPLDWRQLLLAMTATDPAARPTAAQAAARMQAPIAAPAPTRELRPASGGSVLAADEDATLPMHTQVGTAANRSAGVAAAAIATAVIVLALVTAGVVLGGDDEGSDDGPGPSGTASATTASKVSDDPTPTDERQDTTTVPADPAGPPRDKEKKGPKGKDKDKGGKGNDKGGKGKGKGR